jgi:hypothetical protein
VSMLGEEVVQEWLNRKGYFTIRGVKIGNNEIDILAVKPADGVCECRHIEITLSINAIGYISTGNARKLRDVELKQAVDAWIEKKFNERAMTLKQRLCHGNWTKELVVGHIKHEDEIEVLEKSGIHIHRLTSILAEMETPPERTVVKTAVGADLFNLMMFARNVPPRVSSTISLSDGKREFE